MVGFLCILIAITCFALFVSGSAKYVDYPKGAVASLEGLMGLAALGLVPWIVPPKFSSKGLRIVGTITSAVALALSGVVVRGASERSLRTS